ncbi:MAG: hypothetical protein Q9208_006032 [Pyrenodesmia sp. 3 TL-2023]
MDIRSLIDSDASGSGSKAPAASPGARKEPIQYIKPADQFRSPQETHHGFLDHGLEPQRPTNRGNGFEPPHVPPLRQPSHEEFRSPSVSSYNSIQSPYQKTPSSTLSTSQYPFPQASIHSPVHVAHSIQHYQHEGQPFAVNTSHQVPNQPPSLPQTPTSGTLGGSYPPLQQQHRPPSSHSASTPTSGHAQTPTFFRDSPQQTHAQIRGQNISNSNPQYLSQPGTPLGPPTTLGRQSSSRRHESPGSYNHKRTNSGGSHGQHQQIIQSSSSAVRNQSDVSPAIYDPIHAQPTPQRNMSLSQDRERSLSVSPKTRLPSQPQLKISASVADHGRMLNAQVTGVKRKMGDPRMDEPSFQQQAPAKRSMSLGVGGMLNATNDEESSNQRILPHAYHDKPASQPPRSELPSPLKERSSTSNQGTSTHPSSASAGQHSLATDSPVQHMAPLGRDRHPSYESTVPAQPPVSGTAPIVSSEPKSEHANNLSGPTMTVNETAPSKPSSQAPNRPRRYRPGEVPIFAQSWRHRGRAGAQINSQRRMVGRSPSLTDRQPTTAVPHPPLREECNDHEMSSTDATFSHHLDPLGVLGSWEPTITDVIPAEELTRTVMDYLIHTVVQMNGVAFGPAGGSTTGRGAVVEIEAKIGQIIDQNTNDRLRLPVETECVLSRSDPNLRTQFRSSMTVGQHSRLNQFLNRSLQDSKPPLKNPKKPRLPLEYVHTYETDTFYSLSPNALSLLPPSIQHHLDRRNKPKVRITTDQRSGQVTAKIIKVRISNIEIHCPQTAFDWRLSVSLEVNWDGDLKELVESTEGINGRSPDRNKDRMSYKHSHYQIDLTQVKLGDIGPKAEKEHELEVELSSAAVREQGQLVLQQKPNNYEGLVKGFVDNVRLLVRQCRE